MKKLLDCDQYYLTCLLCITLYINSLGKQSFHLKWCIHSVQAHFLLEEHFYRKHLGPIYVISQQDLCVESENEVLAQHRGN